MCEWYDTDTTMIPVETPVLGYFINEEKPQWKYQLCKYIFKPSTIGIYPYYDGEPEGYYWHRFDFEYYEWLKYVPPTKWMMIHEPK